MNCPGCGQVATGNVSDRRQRRWHDDCAAEVLAIIPRRERPDLDECYATSMSIRAVMSAVVRVTERFWLAASDGKVFQESHRVKHASYQLQSRIEKLIEHHETGNRFLSPDYRPYWGDR